MLILYYRIFGMIYFIDNRLRKQYFHPVEKNDDTRDGYKHRRYFRRTTRSTIAPRKYAGWKGGR